MSLALASVAALAAAVALIAWIGRRARSDVGTTALLAGIGAGGWLLAKVPKAMVVLPYMHARGLPLEMTSAEVEELLGQDVVFLALAAAAAGLFEETIKPAGLLVYRRSRPIDAPVAIGWIVGLGAGLLEALNVFAGELVLMTAGPGATGASVAMHAPVERLLVIVFHGALTGSFVGAVARRRFVVASIPILLHALMDFVVPYLQLHGTLGRGWAAQAAVVAVVAVAVVVGFVLVGAPERWEQETAGAVVD